MGNVFKARWGLNSEGSFQEDPWFLIENSRITRYGFGVPPEGYAYKVLPEGTVLPGFVNSHTHLELSPFASSRPGNYKNVHEFALSVMGNYKPDTDNALKWARKLVESARNSGTSYFVDISNNASFSQKLLSIPGFTGLRFLELLGFSAPNDRLRIKKAEEVLEDTDLYVTPHSIYGSSPEILNFVSNQNREIVSIHLLEEPAETGIFSETGITWEFLGKINQAARHKDVYGNNLPDYLGKYFSNTQKLLFVHLLANDEKLLKKLVLKFPRAAAVICNRSNKQLGYFRQNAKILTELNIPLLLGTDSAASSPDLSIINEIKDLIEDNILPENQVWKAATFNAYNYLEISDIPWFFYPQADPDVKSIEKSVPVQLESFCSTLD